MDFQIAAILIPDQADSHKKTSAFLDEKKRLRRGVFFRLRRSIFIFFGQACHEIAKYGEKDASDDVACVVDVVDHDGFFKLVRINPIIPLARRSHHRGACPSRKIGTTMLLPSIKAEAVRKQVSAAALSKRS
jgi:hypothetical protein